MLLINVYIQTHSKNLATPKNLEEEYFLCIDYNEEASTFLTNWRRSMAMPLT